MERSKLGDDSLDLQVKLQDSTNKGTKGEQEINFEGVSCTQ